MQLLGFQMRLSQIGTLLHIKMKTIKMFIVIRFQNSSLHRNSMHYNVDRHWEGQLVKSITAWIYF